MSAPVNALQSREAALEFLKRNPIIAIARGIAPTYALPLAKALCAGGVRALEFTFDQRDPATWADTCASIAAVSAEFAGEMLAGAGTVLSCDQVELARSSGARFIVSPDANVNVIRRTVARGMVSVPGCMTPTEITTAAAAGADFIKLFPIGELGPGYVKAVRAPLGHLPMLAVGGIDENNCREYLRAGCVGLGVGGNLVNREWIAAGQFDRITEVAQKLCAAVAEFAR